MSNTAERKPFEILLVEDNPPDAELVRLVLEEQVLDYRLHLRQDGEQAIELLHRLDSDPEAPRIDLMLMDMHLPKVGGVEILNFLKSSERHARTPVILMSGLNASAARQSGANHHAGTLYFSKPSTLEGYMELGSIVRGILEKNRSNEP